MTQNHNVSRHVDGKQFMKIHQNFKKKNWLFFGLILASLLTIAYFYADMMVVDDVSDTLKIAAETGNLCRTGCNLSPAGLPVHQYF